ncbi:MAG: hypothetical protein SFZ24_03945 [Planctomycetota bacterium]|nr:hypothetical protein [Planctomycetota bacterium]
MRVDRRAIAACLVAGACGADAAAQRLTPGHVLVLYNSWSPASREVADAYRMGRPGVVAFDLNSAELQTGSITREQFVRLVRDPVRAFLAGGAGQPDRRESVACIVTTIGLPGRILSPAGTADEFRLYSAWASLESELTLLQQDLEAPGSGFLARRFNGMVDNPYHTALGRPVLSYSRATVGQARPFQQVLITGAPVETIWRANGLTPGDMYLVCRLDSAASADGRSALENTLSLVSRSRNLVLDRCDVQALLDEYDPPPASQGGFELDEGDVPPLVPGPADFENAAEFLRLWGMRTTHDETFNFVTGPELAAPWPLALLATYGETHSLYAAWGENPPGTGTYVSTYGFAPASFFVAYESWGGTSIYAPGTSRGGQQQALDFIARGGSFAIPTVMEPFAFTIADTQWLLPAMLLHGLTFAEAAYAAIPVLSWQATPVGDPLATLRIVTRGSADDLTGDGALTAEDLYANQATPREHDCQPDVTAADRAAFERIARSAELIDMLGPGAR